MEIHASNVEAGVDGVQGITHELGCEVVHALAVLPWPVVGRSLQSKR